MPSEEQLQAFRQLPLDGRATEIARLFTLVTKANLERTVPALKEVLISSEEGVGRVRGAAGETKGEVHSWCVGEEDEEVGDDFQPFVKKKRRAMLNVGGVKHEVMWGMLLQVPNSRLGLLATAETLGQVRQLCTDYSHMTGEFFFDRHPRSFNSILNFYRTGRLHIQDGVCALAFYDDLLYWQLDELFVETCCAAAVKAKREQVLMDMEETAAMLQKDAELVFRDDRVGEIQEKLFYTMEDEDSSLLANIVSKTSLAFVIISTVVMCLETVGSLQGEDEMGKKTENVVLVTLEAFASVWFTLEYFLRLTGSPAKLTFLKNTANLLDVLAVMPFYVPLLFLLIKWAKEKEPIPTSETDYMSSPLPPWATASPLNVTTLATTAAVEEDYSEGITSIIQIFKIFKLVRIAKLARHSTGIQAIVVTLVNSYKELLLLMMCICISGLMFSSLAYYTEVHMGGEFYCIPNAFWWSVITMTTVGYGDMQPETVLGKLVGTMCAVSGVLVMSIPIPIIVSNFQEFYRVQKLNASAAARKKLLEKNKVKEEEERVTELEGEMVRRDENARVERKRRREEKREERRRKRREEKSLDNSSSRRRVRQSEKEEREEEGWSEEEWCRLLGAGPDEGGDDDDEKESRPGSDGGLLHARNPIYRPRHTQSLADLF